MPEPALRFLDVPWKDALRRSIAMRRVDKVVVFPSGITQSNASDHFSVISQARNDYMAQGVGDRGPGAGKPNPNKVETMTLVWHVHFGRC
jgi:hypothetical protein